jgi:hypothetical protein
MSIVFSCTIIRFLSSTVKKPENKFNHIAESGFILFASNVNDESSLVIS